MGKFISHQNQQQINDALNGAVGESATGSAGQTNLNNSTASAHLNVYKPTFIINNSYQPGGSNEISAEQTRSVKELKEEAKNGDKKEVSKKPEGRISSAQALAVQGHKPSSKSHGSSQQQQLLLMNVLMSQGMDKAQA
jgi:hypothetical protein